MIYEADIRQALRLQGLRATYPRIALITELARSDSSPKSAAELAATLLQFPRSTIYRTLESLEQTGLIRSSLIKWIRRYELGDNLSPHHHHLLCIQCQRLIDFDSQKLERRLNTIAEESDFALSAHTVELRGLCKDCRPQIDKITPLDVLGYGIESMKRLRPKDPLMDKLKDEDEYIPFTGDEPPTTKN